METKLLGNLKKGLLFVLSAPAGTGKTTLVQRLVEEYPCVVASISSTTRKPRPDEIPGVHYNFLTVQEFEKKIEQGEFLEHVQLYGHYYGTSREVVEKSLNEGKHVFLVIDTQGAKKLRGDVDAIFVFLKPPSWEELKERLSFRQTEPKEVIEERLEWAKKELLAERYYDYSIVNDDLETAYQVLKSIVIAEEHKIKI